MVLAAGEIHRHLFHARTSTLPRQKAQHVTLTESTPSGRDSALLDEGEAIHESSVRFDSTSDEPAVICSSDDTQYPREETLRGVEQDNFRFHAPISRQSRYNFGRIVFALQSEFQMYSVY